MRIDHPSSTLRTLLGSCALLSACTLTACRNSDSKSPSSQALPALPSESSTPAPTAAGSPSANSTNIHRNSIVSFKQEVAGTIANIPPRMEVWLLVQPSETGTYWPQRPGPLIPIGKNSFSTYVQFGAAANMNRGEKFTLLIAETTATIGQRFQEFYNNPEEVAVGMQLSPRKGFQVLKEVTVVRS